MLLHWCLNVIIIPNLVTFFSFRINFLLDLCLQYSVKGLHYYCEHEIHQKERSKQNQEATIDRGWYLIFTHQILHQTRPVIHRYYLEYSQNRVPEILELSNIELNLWIVVNIILLKTNIVFYWKPTSIIWWTSGKLWFKCCAGLSYTRLPWPTPFTIRWTFKSTPSIHSSFETLQTHDSNQDHYEKHEDRNVEQIG